MAANNLSNPVVDPSPVVQAIHTYRDDVLHGRVRPQLSQCPLCKCPAHARVFFRRHEARERTFLVVVRDLVHTVLCLITRWKCAQCKRTFTWYPPFALPHKRYVLPGILDRCRRYVEDEEASYRTGVQEQGRPVFHAPPEGQEITADSSEAEKRKEEVRALAHSTLYRWVTTLGTLPHTMRRAWNLIQQQDPATPLVRELASFRVAATKHGTPARGRVLHACRSLCVTETRYAQIFGISIFPNLGTGCSWT
jgi:hypothetical protein